MGKKSGKPTVAFEVGRKLHGDVFCEDVPSNGFVGRTVVADGTGGELEVEQSSRRSENRWRSRSYGSRATRSEDLSSADRNSKARKSCRLRL